MSATWKPCPGYEGIYCVSDHGRVMRVAPGKGTRAGRILTPTPNNKGYYRVSLTANGKSHLKLVHCLVCEAFNGPRPTPKHEATHQDGDHTNNRCDNLKWATHRENMRDKIRHGTSRVGPAKLAILNDEAVREIRSLLELGEMQRVIAARFGVARTTINNIAIGKTWVHV